LQAFIAPGSLFVLVVAFKGRAGQHNINFPSRQDMQCSAETGINAAVNIGICFSDCPTLRKFLIPMDSGLLATLA
jgi:hypothetical protein